MNAGLNMKDCMVKRDPAIEIRVWMARSRIRAVDIARELGVSRSAVTHFLNSRHTSRRITEKFIEKGCPEQLLEDLWRLEEERNDVESV